MGREIGLGRIWSFVLGFRSLVARLVPFERGGTKPDGEKIFGNWKCELIANFSATMVTSPRRERREVWREKRKVRIFGKGKCKFIANFSATMVTSLLSLSLCISLSLSHQKYLTHNIGSASALPIMTTNHIYSQCIVWIFRSRSTTSAGNVGLPYAAVHRRQSKWLCDWYSFALEGPPQFLHVMRVF